jgi:DNA-directed RNA polymerase subunit RPC12/RpoP
MKMINSKPKNTVVVSIFDLPKPGRFKNKVETPCISCQTQLYVYTKEPLEKSIWIVCPSCSYKMIMVPPPRIRINLIKP